MPYGYDAVPVLNEEDVEKMIENGGIVVEDAAGNSVNIDYKGDSE